MNFSQVSIVLMFFYMCVYVYARVPMCMLSHICRVQRRTGGSRFSSSTVWALVVKLSPQAWQRGPLPLSCLTGHLRKENLEVRRVTDPILAAPTGVGDIPWSESCDNREETEAMETRMQQSAERLVDCFKTGSQVVQASLEFARHEGWPWTSDSLYPTS